MAVMGNRIIVILLEKRSQRRAVIEREAYVLAKMKLTFANMNVTLQ